MSKSNPLHHGTIEEQLAAMKQRSVVDTTAWLQEAIEDFQDKIREIAEEMTEQMGSDDYICTVCGKYEIHVNKKTDKYGNPEKWDIELMVGSESVYNTELFENTPF
jgi:predicted transcriptional regulator